MTQIYGTFGPSCKEKEVLKEMFLAGMTGMRLNLSHVDLSDSREQIAAFHAAAEGICQPQLVVDTQGPELRIGDLSEPIMLENHASIQLGASGIPVPPVVLSALEYGDELLLDDGKISLRITDAEQGRAEVVRGGSLSGRKSVKLSGKTIRLPVLTDRDLRNIRQAAMYGVTGLRECIVTCTTELRYHVKANLGC